MLSNQLVINKLNHYLTHATICPWAWTNCRLAGKWFINKAIRHISLKMKIFSLFSIFFYYGSFFSVSAQKNSLPDSLVTIENVYVFCLFEPDKAQQIIDRLRVMNDDRLAFDYEMDWAQADLYFNTGKYRLASYYFERVQEYKKVKENNIFTMGLLSTMVECYRMNNNLEKTMETAIRLLAITEADNIKDETGKAYQYMGDVFFARRDKQQAEKYFEMAEQQLKASGNIPYLYHFYMTYANMLAKNSQYAQALEVVRKAGQILNEVATDPLMMPESYDGYEQSRFHAFAAEILAKNGKTAEAANYYKTFMSLDMGNLTENKILIVPYLLATRKYDEAIAFAHERENYLRQHTDTVGDNMLAVKSYLATAYNGLGLKDKAIENLKQQLSIKEELRSQQLSSATQELAVMYETQKKDAELKEKEAEAKFHRSLLFALSIISLLALVIMAITVYSQKNTKKNNKLMAKQIKDMQVFKESQNELHSGDRAIEKSNIFVELESLMRCDKLYRDTMCNRELIMTRLGIDKNSLLELQHSNNLESLPDYINGFRLDEAISLLDKDSSLSIEEIAKQVGFGSLRSLQRQFKDKYNMSPGEYRKLVKE